MDNTIQFVHKTCRGVWVVIAISSYNMCRVSQKVSEFQTEITQEIENHFTYISENQELN